MRTVVSRMLLLGTLLLVSSVGGSLYAMKPTPLPDVALTALDGQAAGRDALPRVGRWLLVYVQARGAKSQGFLDEVMKEPRLLSRGGIVVVVGGSLEEAKALAAKRPRLAAGAWYADPSRELLRLLELGGAPVALGVRGDTVEWSLAGVVPDGASFRSILVAWLGG